MNTIAEKSEYGRAKVCSQSKPKERYCDVCHTKTTQLHTGYATMYNKKWRVYMCDECKKPLTRMGKQITVTDSGCHL